jgi:hypothetical protein
MRTELIEILIETINDRVKSDHEYSVEEAMDGELNFYMWEGVRSLSDLSTYGEVEEAIEEAKKTHSEAVILKALKASSETESSGIYRLNNSILSWCHGEAEIQIEELNQALEELSPDEIQEAKRSINAYWKTDGKFCNDCVYEDRNYDVTYMVTDLEAFQEALKEGGSDEN